MKARIIHLILALCALIPNIQAGMILESEPNDIFANANYFHPLDTAMGNLSPGDAYDYFQTFVTGKGSFEVTAKVSASSVGGSYLYVYNKNAASLGGAVYCPPGSSQTFFLWMLMITTAG